MKRLYAITRKFSEKNSKPSHPIKGKDGNTIPGEEDQRARWAEHFSETQTNSTLPTRYPTTNSAPQHQPSQLARQRSPRLSNPSSQARQQALMEYHLKH
jgi:hypothetical protein